MHIARYLIIYDLYTQYKIMHISSPLLYMYDKFTLLNTKNVNLCLNSRLRVDIYVHLRLIFFMSIFFFSIISVFLKCFYCCVVVHSLSSYANALVGNLVFLITI